ADVVLLRPDVTAPGQQSKALLDKYSILGPPTILFISPDGEERRGQRVVGELSAKAFIERLQQAQRNKYVFFKGWAFSTVCANVYGVCWRDCIVDSGGNPWPPAACASGRCIV